MHTPTDMHRKIEKLKSSNNSRIYIVKCENFKKKILHFLVNLRLRPLFFRFEVRTAFLSVSKDTNRKNVILTMNDIYYNIFLFVNVVLKIFNIYKY